ncbi:hypothetical protein V8G54_008552 [Vigna mungo]|uniref:NADH dehydrogenase [ubiquinone] 1 beta subcomplex subunit 9 n=1 Tax=Vigna mungo TaxID=3915 RepID=A0AAQ3P437_VIGMU
MASTAAYLARRAAQKERVRILYRRALKDTLNWAVHRHLFYNDAENLRDRFEENKHVEDPDTIDRLIADAEASYNKWRHPDPYIDLSAHVTPLVGPSLSCFVIQSTSDIDPFYSYFLCIIVPWAPGGSKFTRNPAPPQGIEIVYDYGREDNN